MCFAIFHKLLKHSQCVKSLIKMSSTCWQLVGCLMYQNVSICDKSLKTLCQWLQVFYGIPVPCHWCVDQYRAMKKHWDIPCTAINWGMQYFVSMYFLFFASLWSDVKLVPFALKVLRSISGHIFWYMYSNWLSLFS